MDKREAKRIADQDTIEYAVLHAGAMYKVSGYRNASVLRRTMSGSVVLTASEIARIERGRGR